MVNTDLALFSTQLSPSTLHRVTVYGALVYAKSVQIVILNGVEGLRINGQT